MLNQTSIIQSNRLGLINSAGFLILANSNNTRELIVKYRAGDAEAKKKLPAVCFMGRSRTGIRRAADMLPTGYVMLDVDHMEGERVVALTNYLKKRDLITRYDIQLVHVTPSGKGVRIVASLPPDQRTGTLEELRHRVVAHQNQLAEELHLADYGDVDRCVKDLSRLSFVPAFGDIIYLNRDLFDKEIKINITDNGQQSIGDAYPSTGGQDNASGPGNQRNAAGTGCTGEADPLTDNALHEPDGLLRENNEHTGLGSAGSAQTDGDDRDSGAADGASDKNAEPVAHPTYGGVPVGDIAAAYVRDFGEPEDGERHVYYNRMVSEFRNLCNNDPDILVDVLPLFGQDREHRLSQCKSICQRNTTRLLSKNFYFWLKEKGYYVEKKRKSSEDADDDDYEPYAAEEELLQRMPPLPPVFREIVGAAPRKIKLATVFALLPIVGTAATYLKSELYDGTTQTPSFYTIIHAPAGSGKSFVKRFLELSINKSTEANLLHKIIERDFVSSIRVNLWNLGQQQKGANEKSKKRPSVSSRICETITSQADLLPVMKDNQGMHMFMYAAEIDTLMKGMKAGGGGDKNDLFRIAWDNESYGQSYRNAISFRGKVDMYLNVLATGTEQQLRRMFKDVENGLVSRCLFTDLGDQRFAKYEPWRKLSKRDLQIIENWRARCDAETYKSSLSVNLDSLDEYEDEESFDENVPWEYVFKGRQSIDFSDINKALLKWLEDERKKAEKSANLAHDAFRKRAAINGFRAAIAAYSCWKKVTRIERKTLTDFALFVADAALLKYLKTWGDDYNKLYAETTERKPANTSYGNLFDHLGKEFTKGDLKIACNKLLVSSPIRNIVYIWRSAGLIKKVEKNKWTKV